MIYKFKHFILFLFLAAATFRTHLPEFGVMFSILALLAFFYDAFNGDSKTMKEWFKNKMPN